MDLFAALLLIDNIVMEYIYEGQDASVGKQLQIIPGICLFEA